MKANIDKTGDAANKFFEYHDANRVFFSSDLTQKLRQLESEYRKVWATFVPHFGLQASLDYSLISVAKKERML